MNDVYNLALDDVELSKPGLETDPFSPTEVVELDFAKDTVSVVEQLSSQLEEVKEADVEEEKAEAIDESNQGQIEAEEQARKMLWRSLIDMAGFKELLSSQ